MSEHCLACGQPLGTDHRWHSATPPLFLSDLALEILMSWARPRDEVDGVGWRPVYGAERYAADIRDRYRANPYPEADRRALRAARDAHEDARDAYRAACRAADPPAWSGQEPVPVPDAVRDALRTTQDELHRLEQRRRLAMSELMLNQLIHEEGWSYHGITPLGREVLERHLQATSGYTGVA